MGLGSASNGQVRAQTWRSWGGGLSRWADAPPPSAEAVGEPISRDVWLSKTQWTVHCETGVDVSRISHGQTRL